MIQTPDAIRKVIAMSHKFQFLGTLDFLQITNSGIVKLDSEPLYWCLERIPNVRMGTDLMTLKVVDENSKVSNIIDKIGALGFSKRFYKINGRHETVIEYNYFRFHVNTSGQMYAG